MPMRPDFGSILRQTRAIASHVGETAMWREYVSASAGNPAYGIADETYYSLHLITGLFRPATFEEIQQAGGQILYGDINATLLDVRPEGQDEITWRGTNYRVESDFVPERIMGSSGYRGLLRRGDATA